MVSWIQWVGQVGDLSEENQKHSIYGSFRKLGTKVYFKGKMRVYFIGKWEVERCIYFIRAREEHNISLEFRLPRQLNSL